MDKKRIFILLLVVACVISVVVFIGEFNDFRNSNSASVQTSPWISNESAMGSANDGTVSVSITAVGDCTLGTDISFGYGGSFDTEFKNNNSDYSYFLKKVKPYFEKDDITIVNFEGVLTESGTKADKQYTFRGDPHYVNVLTSSSVEAANLANNHSKDYGIEGLESTRKALSDCYVVDFGMEHSEIVNIKGIKVGLIGTNALESAGRFGFSKVVDELKQHNPDLIIASFHWGEESVSTPTAIQKSTARSAIDAGVDLVIGHHPHVLQGIEKYKGKYILYSLGNFCFGGNKNPADKDTMIFNQTFKFKDGVLLPDEDVSVVPCSVSSVTSRNNYQPMPLTGANFDRVKQKIISLSSGFEGVENIRFVSGE